MFYSFLNTWIGTYFKIGMSWRSVIPSIMVTDRDVVQFVDGPILAKFTAKTLTRVGSTLNTINCRGGGQKWGLWGWLSVRCYQLWTQKWKVFAVRPRSSSSFSVLTRGSHLFYLVRHFFCSSLSLVWVSIVEAARITTIQTVSVSDDIRNRCLTVYPPWINISKPRLAWTTSRFLPHPMVR